MEYYFCDTGKELPETYDYLVRLEAYLGKPIARLNAEKDFDHWLKVYGGFLPSTQMRWCTRQLKIQPFEKWLNGDKAYSYIGIRADENRDGYISAEDNIRPVYPFKEDGITKEDVFRILEDSGVGVPEYYKWRTRSGCYFCFFQRKAEWVGLKENHPDLFEESKTYEKEGDNGQPGYTWAQRESLTQLERPERIADIKDKHAAAMEREKGRNKNARLIDILQETFDGENDDQPCMACHL